MSAPHTPGPWEAIGNLVRTSMTAEPRGMLIAEVRDSLGLPHTEESKANARLIAAAPDLLRELQRLLAAYRQAVKLYDPNTDDAYTVDAHNAIAKATGSAS